MPSVTNSLDFTLLQIVNRGVTILCPWFLTTHQGDHPQICVSFCRHPNVHLDVFVFARRAFFIKWEPWMYRCIITFLTDYIIQVWWCISFLLLKFKEEKTNRLRKPGQGTDSLSFTINYDYLNHTFLTYYNSDLHNCNVPKFQ